MPNWCYNYLRITGDKKEIARFKKMSKGTFEIVIKKEEIKEKIKNFLKADHYEDDLEEYLRVKQISDEDILSKELRLFKDKKGNWGHKAPEFCLSALLPCPEEIKHNSSPTRIITKRQYEAQQKRIAKGKGNFRDVSLGGGITKEMSKDFKQRFGADNWYDWNVNNWGTKWDADSKNDSDSKTELSYSFDTAWSPPDNWLKNVSAMFPKLEFTLNYEEGGVGFKGEAYAFEGNFSDNCEEWDGRNEDDEDEDYEDEEEEVEEEEVEEEPKQE